MVETSIPVHDVHVRMYYVYIYRLLPVRGLLVPSENSRSTLASIEAVLQRFQHDEQNCTYFADAETQV